MGEITYAGMYALATYFALDIHGFVLTDGQLVSLPLTTSRGHSEDNESTHPFVGPGADASVADAWEELNDVFMEIANETRDWTAPGPTNLDSGTRHVYALLTGEQEGRIAHDSGLPLLHIELLASTRLSLGERGPCWRSVKVAENIVRGINDAADAQHHSRALGDVSSTLLYHIERLSVLERDGTPRPGEGPSTKRYRLPTRADGELVDTIIDLTLQNNRAPGRPLPIGGSRRGATAGRRTRGPSTRNWNSTN